MLKLIQSTSLIDEVIEQLKGLILDGVLKPGEKFPTEYELCAQLGVSRTAIREAKKSLIGMGLLETRRGQGTYVREDIFDGLMEKASLSLRIGEESIKELIEARRIIEVMSVGLAAERATAEEKERLLKLIEKMQAAIDTNDMASFQRNDLAWHTTISEATRNRVITKMVGTIRDLLSAFIDSVLQIPGSAYSAQSSHVRVTDAILKGDLEGAKNAMNEHLDDVQRRIMEKFSESSLP
jgi:GntR family transcriptional repressor for pyruvate dehydrogenase complex